MYDRIDWRIIEDQPPLSGEDEPDELTKLYIFSIYKTTSCQVEVEASSEEDAYEQVRAMNLGRLPGAPDEYIEIDLDFVNKF